jgi:hypothetical protein
MDKQLPNIVGVSFAGGRCGVCTQIGPGVSIRFELPGAPSEFICCERCEEIVCLAAVFRQGIENAIDEIKSRRK